MTEDHILLEVKNLNTHFKTKDGIAKAVDGVSFRLREGETLGVVGESGSGKSVTSLSIMGLLPQSGWIAGGEILFKGEDLSKMPKNRMRKIRGNDIAMIFQEPMTSLNPVFTIGYQIAEAIVLHQSKNRQEAMKIAVDMLDLVGISEARKRSESYPHQFSGGMRQRVMIAMALSCNPKLLIADEPTTALDVSIQAQILELIKKLQGEFGMALVYITHDLSVVANLADTIMVMYSGRVVEVAQAEALYSQPRMPYTQALIRAVPRVHSSIEHGGRLYTIPGIVASALHLPSGCAFHPRCQFSQSKCYDTIPVLEDTGDGHMVRCHRWKEIENMIIDEKPQGVLNRSNSPTPRDDRALSANHNLLELKAVSTHFTVRRGLLSRNVGRVKAVDNVSLHIRPGEVLGLVGESGSGKTTTGLSIMHLVDNIAGSIVFDGVELNRLTRSQMRQHRKDLQIIFQDPYSSLNPRMTVQDIICEGMEIHNLANSRQRKENAAILLEKVGLTRDNLRRYPHEFSGGQRQRIAIARALSVEPKLIIADEPVSALDVSIQAQIINLLMDLKNEFGLTLLFIAHDLGVVEYVSNRVIVMYLGKIMEVGPTNELYLNPKHPYTESLLAAIPTLDPNYKHKAPILKGDIPSPIDPPSGCVFRTRCPIATNECALEIPALKPVGPNHFIACILR